MKALKIIRPHFKDCQRKGITLEAWLYDQEIVDFYDRMYVENNYSQQLVKLEIDNGMHAPKFCEDSFTFQSPQRNYDPFTLYVQDIKHSIQKNEKGEEKIATIHYEHFKLYCESMNLESFQAYDKSALRNGSGSQKLV